MLFILRCEEAKTDLISSYKCVNMYVTLVCYWECVLWQRSEVGYSCPVNQEVRYKWTEFISFSRRFKTSSCWAHTGKNGP